MLRHSLEGCSRAVNVVSTHQSSYPTPLIERSGTNPSGIISVIGAAVVGIGTQNTGGVGYPASSLKVALRLLETRVSITNIEEV